MSSIVPSARVAIPTLVNKKNLAIRKVSVTTPNQPVTSQNTQPTHTHGTLLAPKKKTLFGGKLNTMEGLLIAC